MKKLYRVSISKYEQMTSVKREDGGLVRIVQSRIYDVIAKDITQAVRKVKYHLTSNIIDPISEDEFVDSVARVGVINIQ